MREPQPRESSIEPAIAFMRRQRKAHKWSAANLARRCEEFGALQEPPIHTGLTRTRIAKLESGAAKRLWIDEITVLAGAFGVNIDTVITNSDPSLTETLPEAAVPPRGTVLDRLAALERTALQQQTILRRLAALESAVELVGNTLGVDATFPESAVSTVLWPEPTAAAHVQVVRTLIAA